MMDFNILLNRQTLYVELDLSVSDARLVFGAPESELWGMQAHTHTPVLVITANPGTPI